MATTFDEPIPGWAQKLITEIAVLNEKIPNHVDYTVRNIQDHEERLRAQEAVTATLTSSLERIIKLEENETEIFGRLRKLEMRMWMAIGALSIVSVAIEVYVGLVNGTWSGK